MTVYQLGNIAKIISGTSPDRYKGNYPIVGSGGYFGMTNQYRTTSESILLPRKGTMNILWIKPYVWNVDTAFLITEVNPNLVIKKFLFYKILLSDWKSKIVDSGTTILATKISMWKTYNIDLPTLATQQQIVDLIAPHEKLFLNYANCVRIDAVKNCQTDVETLIAIVEPILKLKNNIVKTSEKMNFYIKNLSSNEKKSCYQK